MSDYLLIYDMTSSPFFIDVLNAAFKSFQIEFGDVEGVEEMFKGFKMDDEKFYSFSLVLNTKFENIKHSKKQSSTLIWQD